MKRLGRLVAIFLASTAVALSLLSLALAASLLGTNVRVTSARLISGSPLPEVSEAGDLLQQTEPWIAQDPFNPSMLAVGYNDMRSLPASGDAWPGLAISTDGGATWSEALVPGFVGDPACPAVSPACGLRAGSDPLLAFDRARGAHGHNHLYFAFVAFDRSPPRESTVAVARYGVSAAGAFTYEGTVVVGRSLRVPRQQEDKPFLAVDSNAIGLYKGNLYVCWTRFTETADHLMFARSTDHGESYSEPVVLDEARGLVQGCAIAVAPDGSVHMAYRKFQRLPLTNVRQDDGMYMVRSTDGGRSFSSPLKVAPVDEYRQVASRRPPRFRLFSLPAVAADSNGIYLAWANRDPQSGADIHVLCSRDGGRTWQGPAIPHSHATPAPGHQVMPALAAAGGKLSVLWFDSRSEPAFDVNGPISGEGWGAQARGMDVYYSQASTSSCPLTFEPELRVTPQSFNPNLWATIWAINPFIGDYIGIAADASSAYAVWTDHRDINGEANAAEDDDQGTNPPELIGASSRDAGIYFQRIAKGP